MPELVGGTGGDDAGRCPLWISSRGLPPFGGAEQAVGKGETPESMYHGQSVGRVHVQKQQRQRWWQQQYAMDTTMEAVRKLWQRSREDLSKGEKQ